MVLSQTSAIVVAVLAPIGSLFLLFILVIAYRRSQGPPRGASEYPRLYGSHPHPILKNDDRGLCELCQEKEETSTRASTSSSRLVTTHRHSDFPQQSGTEEKPCITQPHFAERPIIMRRLSSNPSIPDTIQRVNSIASTMLSQANPSSELLPYGGRRSSIRRELTYDSVKSSHRGELTIGERRPSPLSDHNEGMVNLRRVSIGGQEDRMSVRSGSQSNEARKRSLSEAAAADFAEPMEILPTPTFSDYTFSATLLPANRKGKATSISSTPNVIAPSPSMKAPAQPDSIVLTQNSTLSVSVESPIPVDQPATTTSLQAIKSPAVAYNEDDGPQIGLFQTWNGFAPINYNLDINEEPKTQSPPLSPKMSDDPASIPLPMSPPLEPSSGYHSPGTSSSSVLQAQWISTSSPSPETKPISPNTRHSAIRNSARYSVDSALAVTTSRTTSPSPRLSRITYLANVVKENEERRRSQMSIESAVMGLAVNAIGSQRGSVVSVRSRRSQVGKV